MKKVTNEREAIETAVSSWGWAVLAGLGMIFATVGWLVLACWGLIEFVKWLN